MGLKGWGFLKKQQEQAEDNKTSLRTQSDVEIEIEHNNGTDTQVQDESGTESSRRPSSTVLSATTNRSSRSRTQNAMSIGRVFKMKPKRQDSAMGASEQSQEDSEGEGDDDENFTFDEVQPNPIFCMWCIGQRFRVLMLFIGLIFIGVGSVFQFVQNHMDASRGFFIAGTILCCGFVSGVITKTVFGVSNSLLRVSSSERFEKSVSTFLFYISATRYSSEQAMWALLSVVTVLALAPKEPNSKVLLPNWEKPVFHLTRIFTIIMLLFVARAATTSLRIYFSQTFNTRAYHDRVTQTMYYENVLNTLLNKESNPWFSVLFPKLDISALAGPVAKVTDEEDYCETNHTKEVIHEIQTDTVVVKGNPKFSKFDPRMWQHLTRYINTHHVDGTELPEGFKHTQVGAHEEMDPFATIQAKRIARRMFERLYAFCEARRAVNKSRKSRPKRALSGSDLTAALENWEKSNEDSTGSSKNERNHSQSGKHFTRSKIAVGTSFFADSNKSVSSQGGESAPNEGKKGPASLFGSSSRGGGAMGSQFIKKVVVDRRKIRKKDFLPLVEEYYGSQNVNGESLWTQLLDPAGTGYTNLKRFNLMIDLMFKGRRNMSITLQDSRSVLHSLDVFIMAAFMIILAMISLALYKVDVIELWVGLSGALLAWSFVFGSSVRVAFECIVFLFAIHPYDVGDMIEVGPTQERYEVRRIHLYSTELLRWDGSVCLMENRHIWDMIPIFNFSTSENKGLVQKIQVDLDCITDAFIDGFRKELVDWLASKPDSFTKEHMFHARTWTNPLKCEIALYVEHSYPNYSLDRTLRDQDMLMRFVSQLLVKYGVRYSGTGLGQVPFIGTQSHQPANADLIFREYGSFGPTLGGPQAHVPTVDQSLVGTEVPIHPADEVLEDPYASAKSYLQSDSIGETDSMKEFGPVSEVYSPSGRRYSSYLPDPLALDEKKDQ